MQEHQKEEQNENHNDGFTFELNNQNFTYTFELKLNNNNLIIRAEEKNKNLIIPKLYEKILGSMDLPSRGSMEIKKMSKVLKKIQTSYEKKIVKVELDKINNQLLFKYFLEYDDNDKVAETIKIPRSQKIEYSIDKLSSAVSNYKKLLKMQNKKIKILYNYIHRQHTSIINLKNIENLINKLFDKQNQDLKKLCQLNNEKISEKINNLDSLIENLIETKEKLSKKIDILNSSIDFDKYFLQKNFSSVEENLKKHQIQTQEELSKKIDNLNSSINFNKKLLYLFLFFMLILFGYILENPNK